MEIHGHTGRLAPTGDSAAEISPICSTHRCRGWRYLDNEDRNTLKRYDFDTTTHRGTGAIGDDRLQAQWIGLAAFMAGTGSCNATIIFDANEQPARLIARSVGKTHNRLDQVIVVERSLFFAFEFDVEIFALLNKLSKVFRCHGKTPPVIPLFSAIS